MARPADDRVLPSWFATEIPLNTTTLLLGVLFGSIGLGLFIYGQKQRRAVPFVCGIALMGFPYFVSNVALLVLIGVILTVIPYFIRL